MTSCIAGLLGLMLSAAPAAPEGTTTTEKKEPAPRALSQSVRARTPEEQAATSGFLFQAGLDHALGLGAFVNPQSYALLVANLTLAPQLVGHAEREGVRRAGARSLAEAKPRL